MNEKTERRILAVGATEDSDEVRVLIGAGYIVETVGSMDEASEKLASGAYSHVLADPATITAPVDELRESEEMYRNLVERSNDGVVVLQDSLVKFVNPRFCELSGYSAETLLGTPFTNYLTPEEIAVLYDRYTRRMAGEAVPSIYETYMTRASGKKIPLEISAAIVSFQGRPADLVLCRDITERKKAEEYLQRFRLLSENARDIILFVGLDGSIIDGNRAAVDTYGYSYDELLGMNISDLVSSEERENARKRMKRAQREHLVFETFHQRRDGSTFPVEVSLSTAFIQNLSMLLYSVRDITERKRAQAVLDDERRRLRSVLDALPVAVFIFDAKGRLVEASEQATFVLGGPVPHLETIDDYRSIRTWSAETGELVSPEEWPVFRALESGETAIGEMLHVERLDGTHGTILNSAAPILDAEGRIVGAVSTAQDITELVHLREALEATLEQEKEFSLLLQRALLPAIPSVQEGYGVAVRYVPVFVEREVGGDFYDVFSAGEGWAGILVGDVSGKGLEAASLAATARSTVHAFVHEAGSAGEALSHANTVISAQRLSDESFVTVCLVILDLVNGSICHANAGHPPAIVLRMDGALEVLPFANLPLGIEPSFDYSQSLHQLNPGDRFVLYTDGISEARDGMDLFDLSGIERALVGHRDWSVDEVADRLIAAATEWAGGKLRDDAAVVVVERLRT